MAAMSRPQCRGPRGALATGVDIRVREEAGRHVGKLGWNPLAVHGGGARVTTDVDDLLVLKVSTGIGAYWWLMFIVTSELTPRAWTFVTLPTLTPEIRTSAFATSSPVSLNSALIR